MICLVSKMTCCIDWDVKPYTHSMIRGRLNYCNSVLYSVSAANLSKLRRVQTSDATRIVKFGTRTCRRVDHATPILPTCTSYQSSTQCSTVQSHESLLTRSSPEIRKEPSCLTDVIRFYAPSRFTLREAPSQAVTV